MALRESNTDWLSPTPKMSREELGADETVELLTLLAENVSERRSSVTRYDSSVMCFEVTTRATQKGSCVEAKVYRDLNDFKKLRTELLVLLPKTIVTVAALNGNDVLPALPAKSLRRASTRQAKRKDIATLSNQGTQDWCLAKVSVLDTWLKETAAVVNPNLLVAQGASNATVLHAKDQILELLAVFLLRGAKIHIATARADV